MGHGVNSVVNYRLPHRISHSCTGTACRALRLSALWDKCGLAFRRVEIASLRSQ